MTDFVTEPNPTAGEEENAPALPYAPSSLGEDVGQSLFGTSKWAYEKAQNFDVEHPDIVRGVETATMGYALPAPPPQQNADPKTLQQQNPGVPGLDQAMPPTVASNIASEYWRDQTRQNILARYPSGAGNWVLRTGAETVAGLLDPVNDAAFMVPIIGEGRYATWLAKAGAEYGMAGRAAVTAGVGAARGAGGSAILAGGHLALDDDYTLGDAAADTLYGAGGGALFHSALSFHGDILGARFAETPEGEAATQNADLHDNAMKVAASQMASEQPVEVRPVFDAHRSRADLMNSTAVGSVPDFDGAAGARMDEAVARAAGEPSQEQIRTDAEAKLASSANLDEVSEGQLAQAKAAVDDMRAKGMLTPEEEAHIAALEREEQAPEGTAGASADTVTIPAGAGPHAGAAPAPPAMPQPTPKNIETAKADLAAQSGGAPAIKDKSLFPTIRKLGGIKMVDEAGKPTAGASDISQIMDTNRSLTNNRKGRTPDMMREALAERGWFGGNRDVGKTDLSDLHGLIDREARGQKVYHPESEASGAIEHKRQVDEDLARAGVGASDTPEEAAHKLAAYRVAAERQDAAWRAQAEQSGLHVPKDATPEDVLYDAIEREAIRAEANGTVEGFADQGENWIDDRLWELAPDIADKIEREDLVHGPEDREQPEPAGHLGAGSEEPAAIAEDAGRTDQAGTESGNAPEPAPESGGATQPAQLDIPGSEPSARQLAAARESTGHGRLTAKSDQALADEGLFKPPAPDQRTLFQKAFGKRGVDAEPGAEAARIGGDFIAKLPKEVSPREQVLLDQVNAIAKKIAPGAKIIAARDIVESGSRQEGEGKIFGLSHIDGQRRIISWSLESPDARGTMRHEAIHYLRGAGFFEPAEWAALEKAAHAGDWIGEHQIRERYPNADAELQTEEAIAEQFGKWNRDPTNEPGLVQTAFGKLKELLSRVGDFIRKAFGADATANGVFSRVASGEVGARRPTGDITPSSRFQIQTPIEAEQEKTDRIVAARKKLIAYQDIAKRKALLDAVSEIHSNIVNRPTLRHPIAGIERAVPLAKAVDAMVRGISEDVRGSHFSTSAEQLARENQFSNLLLTGLQKTPGAMEAWKGASMTRDWVRELVELEKKDGKPGLTKNPLALKIAQAVKSARDFSKYHLNRSGAWIGDYDGYEGRTSHNAIEIHKAGYDTWRDFTLANLDQDKTFAGIERDSDLTPRLGDGPAPNRTAVIEHFMHNVWDALSTGVHISSDHGVGQKAPAFTGPANLGKKLSSERVLHWKDADAWMNYQGRFGEPSMERGAMNSLLRAGRDTALMDRWGSNPKYTFDNLIRTLKEQHRSDHDAVNALTGSQDRLEREFAFLTGEGSRPQNDLASQVLGSIRAYQDVAKLGNVLLTHLSVGATKPFQLKFLGVGGWKSYTSVFRNLAQDKSPEGRAVMESLGAHATGVTQQLMSGYEPIDSVPGAIAKLRTFALKLDLLPTMLRIQKAGTQWEGANFLGQQVGKSFDKLYPQTQRAMRMYGITDKEWDVLRNAPDHDKDGNGSTYLTPKAADRASNAAIDSLVDDRLKAGQPDSLKYASSLRAEARDRLGMKLATLYSDMADRSTVTPGIAERAMQTGFGGKTLGPLLWQYKTWAAAMTRVTWGQALYGLPRGEAVKMLAGLVAAGTLYGYARMSIADALQGKTPREFNGDPANDLEILGASMAQGSGLGIFGDYLFGQYNRYGQSFQDTVGGPVVGDISDLVKVLWDYKAVPASDNPMHQMHESNAEALHFIISRLPIVNTFYLRELSHWLILDRLNEWASPGYLKRYQDRVKKQTGQSFYLEPSQYAGAPQQGAMQ